jgi:hypothetical protein
MDNVNNLVDTARTLGQKQVCVHTGELCPYKCKFVHLRPGFVSREQIIGFFLYNVLSHIRGLVSLCTVLHTFCLLTLLSHTSLLVSVLWSPLREEIYFRFIVFSIFYKRFKSPILFCLLWLVAIRTSSIIAARLSISY